MFGFLDGGRGRGGGDSWSGREAGDGQAGEDKGPLLALLVWGLAALVFVLTFVLPQIVTRRSYPPRETSRDTSGGPSGEQGEGARDSRDGGQAR